MYKISFLLFNYIIYSCLKKQHLSIQIFIFEFVFKISLFFKLVFAHLITYSEMLDKYWPNTDIMNEPVVDSVMISPRREDLILLWQKDRP